VIFKLIAPIHSLPSRRMMLLKQIRKNRPKTQIQSESKQLLIDVSTIIHKDAHTGIQRVVRALLLQFFAHPPVGYKILPIFCTHQNTYKYVNHTFVENFCSDYTMPSGDVVVAKRDIFFALDFAAHLLPLHEAQLLEWKKSGVKIYTLVYDFLPHLHPEWFTHRSVKNFHRWLKTIAIYTDHFVCISHSVKDELCYWLQSQGFKGNMSRASVIPLGSEINATLPTVGIDNQTKVVLQQLKKQKFILMVGTIEPRKGYTDALDAMEYLWSMGDETSLVIVGKQGWKTIKLQERLLTHEQAGKKLFWLKNISDQTLQELYEMASGVLITSYGEGFGLPIVEAMYYGKSLLVRDIPVFREVTAKYQSVVFFNPKKELLVDKIVHCCHQHLQYMKVAACDIPTWHDSVLELNTLFLANQQKSSLHGY